jgi:hypothetical protein
MLLQQSEIDLIRLKIWTILVQNENVLVKITTR